MASSRLGQVNGAGSDTALFLETWSGEVDGAFYARNVMRDLIWCKQSANNISEKFPRVGLASGAYHDADTELTGTAINHAELTVAIDKPYISDQRVYQWDEFVNYYSYREQYTNAAAEKLADVFDQHALINLAAGAAATNVVTGLPGGTQLTDANLASGTEATKAQAFVDFIFNAGVSLDNNGVGKEGRYVIVQPADYAVLVKAMQSNGFSAIHKDLGGMGSIATGQIMMLNGFEIIPSVNAGSLFGTDPGSSGDYANHTYDFTNVRVLAGVRGKSVVCAELMGTQAEAEYQIEWQSTLLVAKMAYGMSSYLPETCVLGKIA